MFHLFSVDISNFFNIGKNIKYVEERNVNNGIDKWKVGGSTKNIKKYKDHVVVNFVGGKSRKIPIHNINIWK